MHETFMKRCLELAAKGLGYTAPNPLVGSVIVCNNEIIGEGYHRKIGESHAEINAINSISDKSFLEISTLYVNLEPCSHFGKTPPCANEIVKYKIPRVVVGTIDSSYKVAGKGIDILRNNACEVITGILENDCREINRRFFTFHEKNRPYIILKWAMTMDGFIDYERNTNLQPVWITNDICRMLVHKWRTEEQAIMIGTETAAKDNPKLNVRVWQGKNPLRIVIDRNLRLNTNLNIFDQTIPTLIFNELEESKSKNCEKIKINFGTNFLPEIFAVLYEKEIQSLIVEGGTKLLDTFLKQNLWDEARVFIGNKWFGKGVKAPEIETVPTFSDSIGDSKLLFFKNNM